MLLNIASFERSTDQFYGRKSKVMKRFILKNVFLKQLFKFAIIQLY